MHDSEKYRLIGELPDGTRDVICSDASREFVEWAASELRGQSSYSTVWFESDEAPEFFRAPF